jgi:hypothetical protein
MSPLQATRRSSCASRWRTIVSFAAGTVRELEARGWTLEEILVAGKLDHRSEVGFDEIVRLHHAGLDWPAIAARVGVPVEQLYQPHSRR